MRRTQAIPLLFAALAIAFFAAPIALRAVGVTAHCCPENRSFGPAPRLADGWKAFDTTTQFLIDRMPGRQDAVRANTWISETLFDTTPRYGAATTGDRALPFAGRPAQDRVGGKQPVPKGVPKAAAQTASQVVAGRDGWLYLQGVFDRACTPFLPLDTATKRWIEFMDIVHKSGRKAVLVVAPDKSTIYPEHVKPDTPNLACSRTGETKLWNHIESPAAQRAGIIGLRRPLLAAKAASRDPQYLRKDSHWNLLGATSIPRAAVPALDPKVPVLPGEIVPGPSATYTGDLTGLLGNPQKDTAPTAGMVRAPGAPTIHGPAVLLADSYGEVAQGLVTPYFSKLHQAVWFDQTPASLLKEINDAHVVLAEIVEREFDYHVTKDGVLSPSFLRMLRAKLVPLSSAP